VVQGLHQSLLLRGAVLGGWPGLGEKTRRGAGDGLANVILMSQGDGGEWRSQCCGGRLVGGGRGLPIL
jgi:hypothetical protein